MIEKQKMKLEPKFRLAEEFLDLKTLNTNTVIELLEENLKLMLNFRVLHMNSWQKFSKLDFCKRQIQNAKVK